MSTELLGYFPETEFFLVSDDVFRPRVTRFRSGNTIFFLAPRYISIGLFQYSLFLIFFCHYRTRKYVVILCFFLFQPIPYLCPTMLNHTKIRAIFPSQLQSFYFITLLFFNRSTGDTLTLVI